MNLRYTKKKSAPLGGLMLLLLIPILIILAIVCFTLTAGMIILKSLLKPIDTSKITDSQTSSTPGFAAALSSHVRDTIIMTPLLAAKKRWAEYPVEKVTLQTSDHISICAYFWRSKDTFSEKAVILVHGFMDSAAGMTYLAEEYHRRGFSVLSVDCRGHGASGGKYISMGYKDADDIVQWISVVQEKIGMGAKIILHGVSMGASAVITSLAKANFPSGAIVLAVSDSSFSDYSKQMDIHLAALLPKKGFQSFIRKLLLAGLSLSNFLLQGFFFFSHSPVKAIVRRSVNTNDLPVLFFHGVKDSMVPLQMAQDLYEKAKEPKKLVIVKNALHIGSFFYEPEMYMSTIESIIGC